MTSLSLTSPTVGQPNSTEEPKIPSAFTAIQTWANGNIDTVNLATRAGITAAQLATAVSQAAGLNDGTSVRRGQSIIATSEVRTNTGYGFFTTPDQVTSVVLVANGLLRIRYRALWRESVSGAARAAIFLAATQLKSVGDGSGAAPVAQEASIGTGSNDITKLLWTSAAGLTSPGTFTRTVYTGDVATPQAWDTPPLEVFVAAGTYNVSVQFKASSGTVTASNRSLLVEAIAFA